MKIVSAELVTSAVGEAGLLRPTEAQVALVGRSNVGKSCLINALARQRVARTSRTPGKTRLINVYRIGLAAAARHRGTMHFVDLPGYGFSRRSDPAAPSFADLAASYFGRFGCRAAGDTRPATRVARVIQLIDARHPGLASDRDAFVWLTAQGCRVALVGTKVDTLSRAERSRSHRAIEREFNTTVLLVSAKTGEGLSDLWKLIIALNDENR